MKARMMFCSCAKGPSLFTTNFLWLTEILLTDCDNTAQNTSTMTSFCRTRRWVGGWVTVPESVLQFPSSYRSMWVWSQFVQEHIGAWSAFLKGHVGVAFVFAGMWVESLSLQGHMGVVTDCAGTWGCGHSFCKSLGSGQCFCTNIWRWALFLPGLAGVVNISTGVCGCGHSFSRDICVWLQFLQNWVHGPCFCRDMWLDVLQGHEGGISVSTEACGSGHSFRWAWLGFLQFWQVAQE